MTKTIAGTIMAGLLLASVAAASQDEFWAVCTTHDWEGMARSSAGEATDDEKAHIEGEPDAVHATSVRCCTK